MESQLDVFKNDAFSVVELQRVAGNFTYVPQMIGSMNLFTPKPIRSRIVQLVEQDQALRLIPTSEIGSPVPEETYDEGRVRFLRTIRNAKRARVQADELQGVTSLPYGSPQQLASAAQLVNERMGKLRSEMAFTSEFQYLGALLGTLLDADGVTVVRDYFDLFGLPSPTVIDIDFAGLSDDQFAQNFSDTFVRPVLRALTTSNRMTPGTYIAALVGDNFWAKLNTHPGFREIWKLEMQARAIARAQNPLANPNPWGTITYGGVTWINYMGTDDGTTIAVPTNEARFFPVGATDVFAEYMSPGETLNDVNQLGKPLYPYIVPDQNTVMPSYVMMYLMKYTLPACIFPKALMRARIKP